MRDTHRREGAVCMAMERSEKHVRKLIGQILPSILCLLRGSRYGINVEFIKRATVSLLFGVENLSAIDKKAKVHMRN